MNEAREVANPEVRNFFNELMEKGSESADPELRRLIAEAHLATRLSKI